MKSDASPSRKEQTHDRIVDAAARALRRAGYAGVGVADVMKDAGLTHGGFYAHFASRDALLVEATERAGKDTGARISRNVQALVGEGLTPLAAFIESYLDDWHIEHLDSGCPVAALCSEMPRQAAEVREASSARVRRMIAYVQTLLPEGVPAERAGVIAGSMMGALQMARAVGSVDEGRALLAAARNALLDEYVAPPKSRKTPPHSTRRR